MSLRVVVLHNEPVPPGPGEDLHEYEANLALYDAVGSVESGCRENGWEPLVRVADDPRSVLDAAAEADVVVNLVEGIGDDARMEAAAAWLLEWSGVPFTGSPGLAMSLALHKHVAKACLAASGVDVPAGVLLDDPAGAIPALRYPLIVKPSREDASLGIEPESVVADESAARRRAARVIERFAQPALLEEFVEGRDVTAALLTTGGDGEPELLPISEFDYRARTDGSPNILTYDAKWDEQSEAFKTSPPVFPGDLPPEVSGRIEAAAREAWAVIGLRDYARIDMRLRADGRPVVIDVNANPDLSRGAGLTNAAARAGIPFPEMIARIVRGALHRGRTPSRSSR